VVAVLTDQPDYKKVRNYWKWLKNKLIAEGRESGLVRSINRCWGLQSSPTRRGWTA